MLTDLSEEALGEYRSRVETPDDFDEFWADTLAAARGIEQRVVATEVETGIVTLRTFDVQFLGFGGAPINAWLRVPRDVSAPPPVIVEFIGYGGGRGAVTENLLWASAGYGHLLMDSRGQGSIWSRGDTPDPQGSGPAAPGFLTRGIQDPREHYYRRLYTDAVRAVEALDQLPLIDSTRVVVLGNSQGGGVALAVAGLSNSVSAAFLRVPFLCDMPRAIRVTDREPYAEVGRWISQHRTDEHLALRTLSYVDGVNFARRATTPAWFSTSLMDPVCPPSTVFGAFHEYAGPKDMKLWGFNGHEGGGPEEDRRTLAALVELFPSVSL